MDILKYVKIFIASLFIVVVIFLVYKYFVSESYNNTSTETVTQNVSNYFTGPDNQLFGQQINTPREPATLVGMPANLNTIQGGDFGASFNTECMNINENGNFMSKCPVTSQTFGDINSQPPSFTVATSLLPKPSPTSEWGVPDCIKESLENQNYLSAAQRIGNNTTNGVLRNPSLDIRNEIPNPMTPVSIWNASTIAPDLYKRNIE